MIRRDYTIFVVAGRLGSTLTVSKAVPFAVHPDVKSIFIFRENQGFPVQKSQYITLDNILARIRPRFLRSAVRFALEPIQIVRHSIKHKPYLINGVFTLPKGMNALIAAKLTRRKSMISVIGGTVEITTRMPFQWFWKKFNLWMLKKCDVVTTKGTKVSKWLVEQGVPSEKIFILNGSIDTETFNINRKVERDIDILFVGNFRKLKGPDRVLGIIKNLTESGKDVKAVFLGTGSLFEETKKQIVDLQLEDFVTLKGYQSNTSSYFKRSKILVMPSMSEGLPTAMLEAMACGCVPVVSDVGNVTDAAHHGVNALVISEWSDIQSFTSAVQKLLNDEPFRNRLAMNGRQLVVDKYRPEKQAEVVDDILTYLNSKDGTL